MLLFVLGLSFGRPRSPARADQEASVVQLMFFDQLECSNVLAE